MLRLEILKVSTSYPEVYVIEEGSFNPDTLAAKVITRVHEDTANKLVSVFNNYDEIFNVFIDISGLNKHKDFSRVQAAAEVILRDNKMI